MGSQASTALAVGTGARPFLEQVGIGRHHAVHLGNTRLFRALLIGGFLPHHGNGPRGTTAVLGVTGREGFSWGGDGR
jgi:hypothetical protein